MAYVKRVEEARKLVAEFDAWLASAPPIPDIGSTGEPGDGGSRVQWETTADLAVRARSRAPSASRTTGAVPLEPES